MLLTVITITRDDERGLASTLDSVASQSYRAFEYIIVNGGEEAGVTGLVRRHGTMVSEVLQRAPGGISDAFNHGVAHATGDVVLFLNSGDTLSSESSLRDAVAAIAEYNQRRRTVFCGRYRYCGAGLMLTMEPRPENLDRHCSIGHQAAFTGIEVLRRLPFDVRIRTAMDYDFWLRCRAAGVPFVVLSCLVSDFGEGGESSRLDRVVYNEMSKEMCKFLGVYRRYRWRDLARFFAAATWTAIRLRARAAMGERLTRLYRRMKYRT